MPRQEGRRHHGGVTAVEYTHLLFLVRMVVGHKLHRQARLRRGELLRQGLVSLDHPQSKWLRSIQKRVAVTVARMEFLRPVLGIPGDDAVHQGAAKAVLLPQPAPERLPQAPILGVAEHVLPEHAAVVRNELAGQQHPPPLSRLPTFPQQAGQLGRKGGGRSVVKPAGPIIDDARLRRVGDHKAQRRAAGGTQQFLPVRKDIQPPADAADDPPVVYHRAVILPPQTELVKPLLRVDARGLAGRGRRHHHCLAVEARPLVHHIDEVIGKTPEEIPLAKLEHPLGRLPEEIAFPLPQRRIGQLFHLENPFPAVSVLTDISMIYHKFQPPPCQSSFLI